MARDTRYTCLPLLCLSIYPCSMPRLTVHKYGMWYSYVTYNSVDSTSRLIHSGEITRLFLNYLKCEYISTKCFCWLHRLLKQPFSLMCLRCELSKVKNTLSFPVIYLSEYSKKKKCILNELSYVSYLRPSFIVYDICIILLCLPVHMRKNSFFREHCFSQWGTFRCRFCYLIEAISGVILSTECIVYII